MNIVFESIRLGYISFGISISEMEMIYEFTTYVHK